MKVILTGEARLAVEAEISAAGKFETGGVLLGWRRPDLDVTVVAAATGPGANAVRGRNRLELDTLDLQTQVEAAFDTSGADHTYLGDWHLHHEARPTPSGRDLASLNELTSETGLAMEDGLLVIVGSDRKGNLTWRAWSAAAWSEIDLELHD
ncbi:MAG: hypothetical protein JWN67_2940 [Actinomycetia bacterium]|nr:hypothetical protein [Actinomycetes bacterium]